MYFLNCFFIYSILGYLLEMCFGLAIGAQAESGFLFGPWTPVYGTASVLIIIISEKMFKNLHMHRFIETIIVLIILTILLTGLELLGGTLIELLLGYSYWDYTEYEFNIGKYICLEFSLIWSVMSVIFIYIIHPLLDNVIKKVPKLLTILVSIIFIIDVMMTFYCN